MRRNWMLLGIALLAMVLAIGAVACSDDEDEEPIDIPLDFTDDIEWRKNGPEEKAG